MNKKFFYTSLFILLAAGSILGSCSKSFVTKSPSAAISIEEALDTATVLASDLTACYAELRKTDQYGRDFPVIGDLMADNTFLESDNTGRYIVQYGYDVPITDGVTDSMWANSYNGILLCNQIIDASATVTGSATIASQAYAIRALLYFKLVTIWAANYTTDSAALGVPLVLHYDPTYLPTRASVGTIYNQIVSDLNASLSSSPPPYSSSETLSQYSIEGLLAKVYLYMGNYTLALQKATDVIDNSSFTLVTAPNFLSFWDNSGTHSDGVEVMFEIDVDAVNNNGPDDLGAIYDVGGYQDLYCSSQLQQLYSPTDVRGQLLVYGVTKGGDSAWLVNKYPNGVASDPDNPKVLRLSEVYLIGAEAAARTGNLAMGWTLLDSIAQTRDPNYGGYNQVADSLIPDITEERRKELAFEGDRLYDMNRLGLTINRASNVGSAIQGNGILISYPDYRRIAPIPESEILRNAALAPQQNMGY